MAACKAFGDDLGAESEVGEAASAAEVRCVAGEVGLGCWTACFE